MSQRAGETRFLLYSHDGLGLGHTRRSLAIASALRVLAPDAPILLATGTNDAHRLGLPPGVEVLKLPSLRKVSNGHYEARHLHVAPDEIRALRSSLLAAAAEAFRPDVVLVDKHPLGVNGELRRALDIVRARHGRAVLGLRDILDDAATVLREWAPYDMLARVAEYYDRVLVYGDPAVFDPVAAYAFSDAVARRTEYCGYVVAPPAPPVYEDGPPPVPPRPHDRPLVLATAGGGEDGAFLLDTFIRAAADAPWQGLAVCGPLMPAPYRSALRTLAAKCGVAFRGFVPALSDFLGRADALVAMGGYNTLAEACSRGLPVVCVPRTHPRKEQMIRARAFERLGLLRVVPPDRLEPARLRDAVDEALRVPREAVGPRALPWDGARRAAQELLRLAEVPPPPQEALVRE